ncbi:hypothetical protein T484DRAFT_1979401 [Baffinella frigidus]|nr:hypothetical protein T484DRAFT_1979401 [Cryptophyta sp. CCMP2293]
MNGNCRKGEGCDESLSCIDDMRCIDAPAPVLIDDHGTHDDNMNCRSVGSCDECCTDDMRRTSDDYELTLELVAKLAARLTAQVDAPAFVDCSGHCTDEPRPSPTRYRRPRECLRLPRRAPLLLRLAARGAMPSPSLLPTIMEEVVESLDAEPNYLARSPSNFFQTRDESSRKRRTPDPEVCSELCLSAHPVTVESLQAILTPDAMEHWKRLRGTP